MSHLAARFVGGADVHVVDPLVDLRSVFENTDQLKEAVESRNLKIDVEKVKTEYGEWFDVYQKWKSADKEAMQPLKAELRSKKDGLLNALALPNLIHHAGKKQTPLLKPSKHAQYLAQQGLMRIDKQNHVIHLVGYPVVVQRMIREQLVDLFPGCQPISPSYFARAAIIEALNIDKSTCIPFTDGSASFPLTYLVGNSLAAITSPFLKTSFGQKNEWPISVQCTGASYTEKKNQVDLCNARQRMKHCALWMCKSAEEMEGIVNDANVRVGAYLDEGLELEVKVRELRGSELKNYESQAFVIENRGLTLSRVSRIGDYISKRLNIQYSGSPASETSEATEDGFVNMVYVETDIDRILARLVDDLIEGKEPPKYIRDAIKKSF
uniref:DNA-directed RNA polymerase n=1 Tax=Caenorhabditis tropicalis TaxID=1561998 RepID=A0A1I7V1W7_9PELO